MGPPTRRFHVGSALRPSGLRVDRDVALRLIGRGAVLIDVRRREDPSRPLAGALRISPDEIPGRLGQLARDVPIVLACT